MLYEVITPESGRIVDSNTAAEAFYGYTHDEMLSMSFDNLDETAVCDVACMAGEDGGGTVTVARHRLADGTVRDVEIYTGPFIV